MAHAVAVNARFFEVSFWASPTAPALLQMDGLEPGDRMVSLMAADQTSAFGADELAGAPHFTNLVDDNGCIRQLTPFAPSQKFVALFVRTGLPEEPPAKGKKS